MSSQKYNKVFMDLLYAKDMTQHFPYYMEKNLSTIHPICLHGHDRSQDKFFNIF